MKIKALSIVAPNGSKIARGEKTLEIRSWVPNLRPSEDLLIVENKTFLHLEGEIESNGVPVAIVKVKSVRDYLETDIQAACATRWEKDYYSWEISDVRPIVTSCRVIAARGIYEVELPLENNFQ